MKQFFAVLFLLACSTSLICGQKQRFGQTPEKPNPTDYPVKMHISASHMRNHCIEPGAGLTCNYALYASAILSGKKFELTGSTTLDKKNSVLLIPATIQPVSRKTFKRAAARSSIRNMKSFSRTAPSGIA